MSRLAVFTLCGFLTAAVVGCGGSDRPPLVEASGKVTLDGDPVAEATVSCQPVDGGRPFSAITDSNGVFSLNAYSDDEGAPAGAYKVAVIKIGGEGAYQLEGAAEVIDPDADAEDPNNSLSGLAGPGDMSGQNRKQIEYLVPERYQNAATSGLTITIPDGGSDSLNLDLKS